MMNFSRNLELLFYVLVDYMAYIPLVFFPFRNRLKHSKSLSYGAMFAIAFGFIIMGFGLVSGFPAWQVPIVSVVVAICVMVWGLEVHPGKCAMVLLMEYCNASFIAVFAKNIELYLFPENIHTLYGWQHSIFILLGVVLLSLFDYFVTWKVVEPIITSTDESKAWNYLWITPLSFYLVWFIYTYSSQSYLYAIPEDSVILAMLLLFEIGSMVTYFILLQLVHYESEKTVLEYQELLNRSQYKNLETRIEDARKMRHDVRHHFLILEAFAKEGDTQGVLDYLNEVSEKSLGDGVLVYCKHFATNTLLSYYSQQAATNHIGFTVKCNIPSEIGISNKDLTVIFGNLLENAMNAVNKVETGDRSIDVKAKYQDAGLSIIIKNTSVAAPKMDKNGRYISTSHNGYGIGIDSVKTIVKKYNGFMDIKFEDGIVTISIMLMI